MRYTSDRAVLHVTGRMLVGPQEARDELWVLGGRIRRLGGGDPGRVKPVQRAPRRFRWTGISSPG
ncbi:hypothetical protein [Streptomyces sp. NPDC056291]|uniref:hypothetical protein n=1 Tax=unclassified Streptomyces TaxID=2593676 RepID=UPI0035E1175E